MFGLTDSPRKSVKKKAWAVFLHPVGDNTDGKLIRNKQSLAGPCIGFLAQRSSTLALGTQQRTRGDMGNT